MFESRTAYHEIQAKPNPQGWAFCFSGPFLANALVEELDDVISIAGSEDPMKVLVHIRPPVLEDEAAFLVAARRSRALHHPWTSAPPPRPCFMPTLSV